MFKIQTCVWEHQHGIKVSILQFVRVVVCWRLHGASQQRSEFVAHLIAHAHTLSHTSTPRRRRRSQGQPTSMVSRSLLSKDNLFSFSLSISAIQKPTLVTRPDGAPKKLLCIISQRVYLFAYRGRNFQVGKIISVKSREFQLYNVFVRFLRCIKFC